MSADRRRYPALLLAIGDGFRAQKRRRNRLRRRLLAGAVGAALVVGTAAFPPTPWLVWNASVSAPIGLYWVMPGISADTGDMVVARMTEPWRSLAARRRYLPANVPLVKRVVAIGGDQVCALGRDIFINGVWIAGRHAADRQGRPLPGWSGCLRLRGSQLFLMMDHPDSFDGRYFGAIEGANVVGKAVLLWRR